MMKLLEKQQLTIILAALGIVGLFLAIIYVPLAKQSMQLRERQVSFSKQNDQVKSQVELIPSTFRERAELLATVGDYDARIPMERNFAQVWEQLAQAMNEQGLSDQLIQPSAEVEGEQAIMCIPLSIECTGQMSSIFGFFQSLENMDRLIRVEKLGITKEKEKPGLLKMTATAKIFYRKEKSS